MITLNQTTKSRERGVAMVMALLALLLLSTVVAGMLMMSNGETRTNTNFRDEQMALLASKSGLEEVRDRLRTNAPDSLKPSLPTTLPGTANGILYVTNAAAGETVAPWNTLASNYPDTEICNEVSCTSGIPAGTPWYFGPQLASNSYAATPQLPWKWVRVMQKKNKDAATTRMTSVDGTAQGQRVCWNGTSEVITTQATCQAANTAYQPVYELTALSVTNNGSRRMTQYEVVSTSFPPPPGAMVFDGPSPTYNAPNSNVFTVSGNDANQGPTPGCLEPRPTPS